MPFFLTPKTKTFEMRAFLAGIILLFFSAASAVAHPAPDGFAALTKRLSPAVVNISTRQHVDGGIPKFPEGSAIERFNDLFNNEGNVEGSMGSGFVIDPSGVIVTNNHVIADADEVDVAFSDGLVLPAKVVGRDAATDLAVLRVTADHPLPTVPLGDSSKAEVGDWVIAIGNPFGLGGSVSAGIISARNRDISSGRYDQFIQTDAAINRGNSGGPLFDMDGEVIGVNSAILSPSGGSVGIGFAIPSNLVSEIVEELLKNGHVTRGWLGARVQSISLEMAKSYGLEKAEGAMVFSVTKDGPAEKAGLKAGDLVLKFGDKDIADSRTLTSLVAKTKPGTKVKLQVNRDGKEKTMVVTVQPLMINEDDAMAKPPVDEPKTAEFMGMELSVPNAQIRRAFNIRSDVDGLVVVRVLNDATGGKIVDGDVLQQIGWKPVNSLDDLQARMQEIGDSKKPVLVLINRNGESLRLTLNPG